MEAVKINAYRQSSGSNRSSGLNTSLRRFPIQPPLSPAPFTVRKISGQLDELSGGHHRHDFYMLYWATSGTGNHHINFQSCEMKPGRVFFILAGQVHQVSKYAPEGWMILFDSMLYQHFITQNGLEAQTGLFDHCCPAPYVDLEPGMLENFDTLARLMQNESELPVIKHYLSVLLLHANKQYLAGKEALFFHPNAVIIRKLKLLIEAHYKTERLTAFYCKNLGLPARRLNLMTTQSMGKLVMELVSDRLLAESETMLAATGLPVKAIAYELGFIDQGHFATWFRKQKGMNPKTFRHNVQTHTGNSAGG